MHNIKIKINSEGFVTHVVLFSMVGVLFLVLIASAVSKNSQTDYSVLGDDSSEVSTTSEESANDEESEISTKSSDIEEVSTPSVSSLDEEESVDEVSTVSLDDVSVDETSEDSQVSTVSEASEASVEELPSIDDFETTVELGDGVVVVSNKERLFFLIPVDIEQTLQLGENGDVVNVQQSLLSRILSFFSF